MSDVPEPEPAELDPETDEPTEPPVLQPAKRADLMARLRQLNDWSWPGAGGRT